MGAACAGRWQFAHFLNMIGATSRVNVGPAPAARLSWRIAAHTITRALPTATPVHFIVGSTSGLPIDLRRKLQEAALQNRGRLQPVHTECVVLSLDGARVERVVQVHTHLDLVSTQREEPARTEIELIDSRLVH